MIFAFYSSQTMKAAVKQWVLFLFKCGYYSFPGPVYEKSMRHFFIELFYGSELDEIIDKHRIVRKFRINSVKSF